MPLTAKQERFAQLVASGLTQSDAYRQAYDVSPSSLPSTTWSEANALATENHHVSTRIYELKQAAQAAALAELAWDKTRLVREAESNMDLARTGGWRGAGSANGALEIIGRATGILSDKPRDQNPVRITRVVVVLSDSHLQPVPELPPVEALGQAGGIIVDVGDDENLLEATGGDDDNRNEEE